MNPRTAIRIAQTLSPRIGAHYRALSAPWPGADEYARLQRDSDEAERLLRYLVQHLADRHAADILARAAGCPGYINMR